MRVTFEMWALVKIIKHWLERALDCSADQKDLCTFYGLSAPAKICPHLRPSPFFVPTRHGFSYARSQMFCDKSVLIQIDVWLTKTKLSDLFESRSSFIFTHDETVSNTQGELQFLFPKKAKDCFYQKIHFDRYVFWNKPLCRYKTCTAFCKIKPPLHFCDVFTFRLS